MRARRHVRIDHVAGAPHYLEHLDRWHDRERPSSRWGGGRARRRIEREREEASQRLAKTRDVAAWQATMARLDAEQQVAKQPRQQQRMAPDEVVAYLRLATHVVERLRTRRTPGPGRGAVHEARSGGLYEDAICTHAGRCYRRSRRSPTGADGDRWSHRWVWSGREDLNLRPQRPERCALPNCATPRQEGPTRRSGRAELGL